MLQKRPRKLKNLKTRKTKVIKRIRTTITTTTITITTITTIIIRTKMNVVIVKINVKVRWVREMNLINLHVEV